MVREKEKRGLKDTVDTNQAEGDVINLKNVLGSDTLFPVQKFLLLILVIK